MRWSSTSRTLMWCSLSAMGAGIAALVDIVTSDSH
jgi:hypothetical protein